ncbi:hypothetical protein BK660_29625 [Pseudomonas brassicacearum]|uniref:Uncharacterized protein n=1 Tax=Pseudomonas brassicacearum TaxID=930166 RepID=A0A423HE78_9PSED|nr:hypothetical protein BK660_29625 [Pseudomonas brassicacearum]
MPIPRINFSNAAEKAKHDKVANLQKQMNKLYSQIKKADERSKTPLERQFENLVQEMSLLVQSLFDLGDFDKEIPTVKELYGSL